jgi:predicted nucleic acid-binding Zn ribbon protein
VKHRRIADRLLDRTCLECSAPIPDDANARVKFCGLACTRRHNNRRTSERRSEARAAARPTWSTLTCQVCGRAFTVTRRTDAKYCSATCNTAAYRARQLNGPAKLNGHCHETHRPLADQRPDLAAGRERDCSDQDASQPVAV